MANSSTGVVIRFYDHRGFGFIKPDSSVGDEEDLFVHHSDIQSDGYRSLYENQKVRFSVRVEDDKKKAVNVTAFDGTKIEHRRDSRDGGVRRSGFRGNGNGAGFKGVDGIECYNCGGIGHLFKDCSSEVLRPAGCYTCHALGHVARECPRTTGRRGGCFKCGKDGHLARDCSNNTVSVDVSRVSRGVCYNCNEAGHMAKDCTSDAARAGHVNDGCYKCGQKGHIARECSADDRGNSSRSTRPAGVKGNACYNCGDQGHYARECQNITMTQ